MGKDLTINYDVLIAEFDDLQTQVFKPSGIINYYHKEFNSGSWFELEELNYNCSWDWLIPVIKEIHEVEQPFIFDLKGGPLISDLEESLKSLDIESVYKAVVQFILWYNEQKVSHIEFDENGNNVIK